MTQAEFREFLLRWTRWFFHDHSLRGLGIAQSAYAERVGKSASTADPADDVEPDISRWHDLFRTELPEEIREAIRIEYLVPGKKSEKHKEVGCSARDYGPRLALAVDTARQIFLRAEQRRREAAENRA